MSQTLVLSVGWDPMILHTRNLLLQSAGYIVVSAMSMKDAVHLFQDGDFDLVILCNSISTRDCERLRCLIRASGSRIPIVCVAEAVPGDHKAFAEAHLDEDPVAFLRTLEDVLSKHAKVQLAGVSVAHNHGEVNSAKNMMKPCTAADRRERRTQDHAGIYSFLERTRECAPSY